MSKTYPYYKGKWTIDLDSHGNEYSYEIILTPEEAKPFRAQFKQNTCKCGFDISKEPILGYGDHNGGWTLEGYPDNPYWLWIHCPKCGYDLSIWKIGVARERY